jgi:transcriptional regulator with XRE-family HTH domain
MTSSVHRVNPFGASLRRWRLAQGSSQLVLADRAGTTSRHLSFLETGRSRPSREMVRRLAQALNLPLRETNELLLAAGLAAEFPEASLSDDGLEPFAEVIDQMLRVHEPYPAFAIDRRWTIVRANQPAQRFLPDGVEHNVVRMMYAGAWREQIANWDDIAWPGALRVQGEAAQHPDDEELAALAALAVGQSRHLATHRFASAERVLCPHFRIEGDVVRTISVIAQFGGARDVTLDELRVELFFPADALSAQMFARLHVGQS